MPGCAACGGGNAQQQMETMNQSYPDRNGMWKLGSYPGCTESYRGKYEGLSVYVVGRNTPIERIYGRDDYAGAVAFLKSAFPERPTIEKLPSSGICRQAVIFAFEGAGY